MSGFVLADVGKVAAHGLSDVYMLQRHAQRLAKALGIGARALRSAEARHRYGDDVRERALQQGKGPNGDEQCKAAVQSAGDADNSGFSMRMFQTLFQA